MPEMCSPTIVLLKWLIFYTDCTLCHITLFVLVFTYCRCRFYVFIFYSFI